ncbi:MAG TPA: PilZ domain-containing protein [Desulfurivibrio alkaliphilus]|uniref:PilZ domain-containing protein n=1 Tax=Desulfurivibrio alkaliphilus TaxID=427923 RepID=A0A7C2XNJ3_9BACT|nr:PilZ domain-containing protein [Desulfurivibrio alkaliphilus]
MGHAQIVRHDFRVPVSSSDAIKLKVDGKEYEVINLSNHGIGFRFSTLALFKTGSTVEEIELTIGGQQLRLAGRVIHVSRLGEDYLCGIDLLNLTETSRRSLESSVSRIRTRLFKEE